MHYYNYSMGDESVDAIEYDNSVADEETIDDRGTSVLKYTGDARDVPSHFYANIFSDTVVGCGDGSAFDGQWIGFRYTTDSDDPQPVHDMIVFQFQPLSEGVISGDGKSPYGSSTV